MPVHQKNPALTPVEILPGGLTPSSAPRLPVLMKTPFTGESAEGAPDLMSQASGIGTAIEL